MIPVANEWNPDLEVSLGIFGDIFDDLPESGLGSIQPTLHGPGAVHDEANLKSL